MFSLLADAPANANWYLAPLVLCVSLVYSATRHERWSLILLHTLRWIAYLITFLGGAYLLLHLVSLDLADHWYVLIGIVLLIAFFWNGKPHKKPGEKKPETNPPTREPNN